MIHDYLHIGTQTKNIHMFCFVSLTLHMSVQYLCTVLAINIATLSK